MEQDKEVQDYFERAAKDFDDIYDNEGGPIKKAANKIFRKGMKQRFNLTLELCGSSHKTILDIGCGAGRFTIPLAERGFHVLGIDYSNEMIKMAEEYLKKYQNKKNDKLYIKYACCDFITGFNLKNKVDISLALGVFDYIKDPLPFLKKMKQITNEKIIASFPARYTPQMPVRKIWLSTKKCPVYFYTKKDIKKLCLSADINNYKIHNVSAGYVLEIILEKD